MTLPLKQHAVLGGKLYPCLPSRLFMCSDDFFGVACRAGERRTTCDPTWRPMIVYIATIFAVLRQLIRSGSGDRFDADASMDGGGEAVGRVLLLRGALRRWGLGGR